MIICCGHNASVVVTNLPYYCCKLLVQPRLKFPGWAMPTLIFSRVGACPPCSPRAGAHVLNLGKFPFWSRDLYLPVIRHLYSNFTRECSCSLKARWTKLKTFLVHFLRCCLPFFVKIGRRLKELFKYELRSVTLTWPNLCLWVVILCPAIVN